MTFHLVPVGNNFDHGGSVWRKQSTRTARIVWTRGHDGQRWWIAPVERGAVAYFKRWEQVNQEQAWWRAMGAH